VTKSFETLQLLWETFLLEMLSFRDILPVRDFLLILYNIQDIPNNALRFLENYGRYGKMFRKKVVLFGGGHNKIPMI